MKTPFFPLNVNWKCCPHGSPSRESSNRLSRFFGSKLARGAASSVRTQLRPRRCDDLVDGECWFGVELSFMLSEKSSLCMGLTLGVSVWQEPLEWMLEGVCAKLWDQSPRFEWQGVWAGLRWLSLGEPGRGVDVLPTDSLDLTLWRGGNVKVAVFVHF